MIKNALILKRKFQVLATSIKGLDRQVFNACAFMRDVANCCFPKDGTSWQPLTFFLKMVYKVACIEEVLQSLARGNTKQYDGAKRNNFCNNKVTHSLVCYGPRT